MSYQEPPLIPPPPGGQEPPHPDWCLRRQIALLMILIGFALFIWSL